MRREALHVPDRGVDEAIDRVLAAEQGARDAIAAIERQCDDALDQARSAARTIAERAERRIRVARERFEANVVREAEAIRAQAESLAPCPALDETDARRVANAVERLAEELTGGAR